MDVDAVIRQLIAEWAAGTADGPGWDIQMRKLAHMLRHEMIADCQMRCEHPNDCIRRISEIVRLK